jgi:hypothetical protein
VKSYDEALKVIPGLPVDAGDPIGRDAAHNRAIALRRAQEEDDKKDAGPKDAGQDSGSPDAGPNDAGQDQKPDSGPGEQDGGQPNAAPDAGGEKDAGSDAGQQNQPDPHKQDGDQQQQPPKPEPKSQNQQSQDEAILDQLEQAPSVQQQDAKNRSLRARRGIGMEDK